MSAPYPFVREAMIKALDPAHLWDVVIIGGGASGVGAAVDAATRGYSTLLIEQSDFAKGTSSRSTKLVHGGVRYLAQGNIRLVYDALHERGVLLRNAPHVVQPLSFVIPCYSVWDKIKYLTGLKLYDLLAGKFSFGRSEWLSKAEVRTLFPNLNERNLLGGVRYYDGQFDDARLAVDLARTAAAHGAVVVNYMRATALHKENGKIAGLTLVDQLSGDVHTVRTKAVINATGIFVDDILHLDDPARRRAVTTSQGTHIVLDKSFLSGGDALMIPKTSDGRVVFAVPWHGHIIVGTTDNPLDPADRLEPAALDSEIQFLLETIGPYLGRRPSRYDIRSVFAGLRPLAAPTAADKPTREISRSHKITVSESGLVTMIGGKWTTYRQMAEDAIDAIPAGALQRKPCVTRETHVYGYAPHDDRALGLYGSDEGAITALVAADPALGEALVEGHPHTIAEVVWAVRSEMAMTVEDVLARRLRLLFVDANAAIRAADRVAEILANELHLSPQSVALQRADFLRTARHYVIN